MKFLFTNIYNFYNKGELAQLYSLIANLPGSEFSIAPFYSYVKPEVCDQLGITIAGRNQPLPKPLLIPWALLFILRASLWSLIHKIFHIRPNFLLPRELRAYLDCDVVIDLGGDTFTDDPSFVYSLVHCFSLFPAILFSKPYVICSQSIGPFKSFATRLLTKFVLNRAHVITAREKITENYLLSNLGVNHGRVVLTNDLAFLLEVKDIDNNGNEPIIAVNPSGIISRWMFPECKDSKERSEKYLSLMAKMIDEFATNYKVILIPHVTGPTHSIGAVTNPDDRIASRQIYARLRNQSKVEVIEIDHDLIYTKEFISRCHLFVGCRMHACVAAISSGVPTVALAYSHKTIGVVQQVEVPWSTAVDVRNKDYEQLLLEITQETASVQQHKREKSEVLREIAELKQLARLNINLIQNLHDPPVT